MSLASTSSLYSNPDDDRPFFSRLRIFFHPSAEQIFWHQNQLNIPYHHPEAEWISQLRNAEWGVDLAATLGFVWVRHPLVTKMPNGDSPRIQPFGVNWLIDPRDDWPLWRSRFKSQNLALQIAFIDPESEKNWITISEEDIDEIKDQPAYVALRTLYRKKYFSYNYSIKLIRERGTNYAMSNLRLAPRIWNPGPYTKAYAATIQTRLGDLRNRILVFAKGQPESLFVFDPNDQVSDTQNLSGDLHLVVLKDDTAKTVENLTYDLFFLHHENRPRTLKISAQLRAMLLRKKRTLTYGELAEFAQTLQDFSAVNFEAWQGDVSGYFANRLLIRTAEEVERLELSDLINAEDFESKSPVCRELLIRIKTRINEGLTRLK